MARRAAVDADGHDPGRAGREREGLRHRFAGGRRLTVTTLVRQPGRRARLGEQVEEHRGLANGRDRLEGEEVHAGLEEGLDTRRMDVAQGGIPRVVVAGVLRAVGEHRPVRPDRAGNEQAIDRATGLLREPITRTLRERDAPPDRLERGRAIQAGRREPRDRRLVACRGRDLRPGLGNTRDGPPRSHPVRSAAGAPTTAGRRGRDRPPRARSPGRRRRRSGLPVPITSDGVR